jgi:hypothetical protein
MKMLAVHCVLILVLMTSPLVGGADEPAVSLDAVTSVERDLETIARDFVSLLSNREFEEAVGSFSAEMTAALSPEGLEAMWDDVTSAEGAGEFEKVVGTTSVEIAGYEAVIVTCEFANRSLGMRVVLDKQASIAGIHRGTSRLPSTRVCEAGVVHRTRVHDRQWRVGAAGDSEHPQRRRTLPCRCSGTRLGAK